MHSVLFLLALSLLGLYRVALIRPLFASVEGLFRPRPFVSLTQIAPPYWAAFFSI
jgi:hypothetical protein